MSTVDYAPLLFASVGTAIGVLSWNAELLAFSLMSGYFLGKLLQSLVWTVTGPPTTA